MQKCVFSTIWRNKGFPNWTTRVGVADSYRQNKMDFGFRILDLVALWSRKSGFWISDFGFWIMDFGLNNGFWIMDFGLNNGLWILSKTTVFWTNLWVVGSTIFSESAQFEQKQL